MKVTDNQYLILQTLLEKRNWMSNKEIQQMTNLNITSMWMATRKLNLAGLVIKMKLPLRGEPAKYKITRDGRKLVKALIRVEPK